MDGRGNSVRIWVLTTTACLCLGAAACGGASPSEPADTHAGFFAQLPLLPDDAPAGRRASDLVPIELTGADNWDNSGNVTVDGDSLTVTSIADRLDWVMYRYNLGLETSTGDLTVNMTADTGEAYVLVSNYTAGFWQIHGPYTGQAVIDLSGGMYFSPGLAVYAVVAVYDGAEATIASSSLIHDNQVATPDYLSGMADIFADNCMPCHSTASATSGIILDTFWNAHENADAALAKALADHAPSGAGTLDAGDKDTFQAWVDAGKPYGAAVSYTSDIDPIISMNCSGCHTGGGTAGGVDLDGYANAAAEASASWDEIRIDDMPPGGPLSSEQKDKWLAWIEQGTSE